MRWTILLRIMSKVDRGACFDAAPKVRLVNFAKRLFAVVNNFDLIVITSRRVSYAVAQFWRGTKFLTKQDRYCSQ